MDKPGNLKPLLIFGKYLTIEFYLWDLQKLLLNCIAKILIIIYAVPIIFFLYKATPKSATFLLNVTEITYVVRIFAISYMMLSCWIGSYSSQKHLSEISKGIDDVDKVLQNFKVDSINFGFKSSVVGFTFLCCYVPILFIYVLFYCHKTEWEESYFIILIYFVPNVSSLYKTILYSTICKMLRVRFWFINKILEKFQCKERCLVCVQNKMNLSQFQFLTSDLFNELCEVHLLK